MGQEEFIIAMTGLLGGLIVIFVVIPVIIFLIVKKILNDRHKERLAMIEKGFVMHQNRMQSPQSSSTETVAETATSSYEPPIEETPVAEDSTIKWMFILGGLAVGFIVSAVVVDWINYYTVMDTGGMGFSIVVLCACGGLFCYYRRKASKKARYFAQRPHKWDNPTAKESREEEKPAKEEYTED